MSSDEHASRLSQASRSLSGDSLDAIEPIVARSSVGTAFYLFNHQVGGHKPFLRSAPGEVCKPAIPLELAFYRALSDRFPQLEPFVPAYLGTITVDLEPHSEKATKPVTGRKSSKSVDTSVSYSLWHKEVGKTVEEAPSFLCEYLVLGDLTSGYTRPCVLDIKMGTRQHGEDTSDEKARSHTLKCAATTSAELGLRLCGMQIYRQCDSRYVLRDKHWGRRLHASDIEPALLFFVSNGETVRQDAVAGLLQRLHALKDVIAATNGIRFWGASLLLVYEGETKGRPTRATDVRLIDFAHSHQDPSIGSPDEGLLLGLSNLIAYLTHIASGPPTVSPPPELDTI
ncbi:hypothetical protein SDRG_03706 [Saprolegnia diclina VS20]|uniref:Kinase n=1 Tax=Saprolegnia diclina (strain VS20) TaxID=1156394 RepID=T0S7M6_SAPDV|nr:hypothetical protein SDRG_03706 [Saprolegnia diclina VS20]EQC38742.1 hypothetical protein SDRG_03706 [Saprolegnia diclina VS20]|eukprot:XP_008607566.1 hypothetical protein SDRG_03706 [Saprolegnia diclina VS20]